MKKVLPGGSPVVEMHGIFPNEQYIFNIDALRRMLNCGVYIVSGKEGSLYVGSAKNLLARISDDSHGSFRQALCEADWASFLMQKSEALARDEEARYIATFQPKYNKRGKSTTSSWAKAIWDSPDNKCPTR